MTRFVIDAPVVLHLLDHRLTIPDRHTLLAPALIRSQVLSLLHEASVRGEIDAAAAKKTLAGLTELPIRLLGDSALRRRAWAVADELGWSSTYDAEYVALTQLQGDFLVTLNTALAMRLDEVVPLASIDDLVRP